MNKNKTLSEVAEDFLFARTVERYSPATIRTYKTVLDMFAQSAGESTKFDQLGPDAIRRFLAEKIDLEDKTVCNYHTVLAALWTWAVEQGYTRDHVVHKVKRPRYVRKPIEPFNEDQVKRIFKKCRGWRERAIILILLDCGIRASELVALTVDDWIPGALIIRKGKGKKARKVPITEFTERAIFRSLGKRVIYPEGMGAGLSLFSSQYPSLALTYDAIRSLMDRLEERSSVPNIHAHRFRHTFAINYLRNNGDIYTLKRILGHSDLKTVQIYLHIAQNDLERVHDEASPVLKWFPGH